MLPDDNRNFDSFIFKVICEANYQIFQNSTPHSILNVKSSNCFHIITTTLHENVAKIIINWFVYTQPSYKILLMILYYEIFQKFLK